MRYYPGRKIASVLYNLQSKLPIREEFTLKSTPKPFSFWKYNSRILLQLTVLLMGIRALFPTTWANQIKAGALSIIMVFVVVHFFNSPSEWSFHRYNLHMVLAKCLKDPKISHHIHHELTSIRLHWDAAKGSFVVSNKFPIEKEEQLEKSVFPWWAPLAVFGIFVPPLAALQFLFPHIPLLLGGIPAFTFSLMLYENCHQLYHLPYEWWLRRMANPYFGKYWTKRYMLHYAHHKNYKCNMGVGGFFTFLLWDWILGTLFRPDKIHCDGSVASDKNFATIPPPCRFVQWLDRLAAERQARLQTVPE